MRARSPRTSPARNVLPVLWVLLIFASFVRSAGADVLYVHQMTGSRLWTGEESGQLRIAFQRDAVLFDLQKAYTGSWIRRIFGEPKKERRSTLFLLDAGEIREVAWAGDKVFIYPLERVRDIQWLRSLTTAPPEVEEVAASRYQVRSPQLTIVKEPGEVLMEGYRCRRVEANLRLETYDRRKKALSVTEVRQVLWLSREVPGMADREAAYGRLSARLGLEAARLGNLSSLLRYWEGPLEPIRRELEKAQGYPVKTTVEVDARYVPEGGKGKEVTKRIKEETIVLKEVATKVPEDFCVIPSHFSLVPVR